MFCMLNFEILRVLFSKILCPCRRPVAWIPREWLLAINRMENTLSALRTRILRSE